MDINKLKKMGSDMRRQHKVTVDPDKCMGCRKCIEYACCFDVYRWDEEKNCAVAKYSEDCACCRQCKFYCPADAITIEEATIAFYDVIYDTIGYNDLEEAD